MLKQMLRSAQVDRELLSIVTETTVIQADSAEAKECKLQMVAYSRKLINKEKVEGPPYLLCFAGLLKALASRGMEIGKKNQADITDYKQAFDGATLQGKVDMCKTCRLETMFKQDLRRLVFAVSPEASRMIGCALEQLGGERKLGKAPPSYLERELQDYLEALES